MSTEFNHPGFILWMGYGGANLKLSWALAYSHLSESGETILKNTRLMIATGWDMGYIVIGVVWPQDKCYGCWQENILTLFQCVLGLGGQFTLHRGYDRYLEVSTMTSCAVRPAREQQMFSKHVPRTANSRTTAGSGALLGNCWWTCVFVLSVFSPWRKSRPRISKNLSFFSGKAVPIFILVSSLVWSPIAKLYFFLM